jgi:hypothetical protein
MLDATKDVQGIAVYTEFVKPGATMQILITPDGYDSMGAEVPASLYRRVTTPDTLKKQWRDSKMSWRQITNLDGAPLENADKELFAESRLSFATQLFDGVKNGGWIMKKEPLLIEASKKDLDDVKSSKTPNKLMYRINQTKTALGFDAVAV